ncbi:MAG: hypothetical protein L6R41_001016 [Letrouitia leprolyta]|nr:MAG: hypothetical protein L6R41_001016 [Letrouitia leprolyta]
MEDVDLATFTRFLEWTYNGCYTAPTPKDESSPSDMAPAEDNSDQRDIFGSSIGLGSKKKKKNMEKTEWGSFGFDQPIVKSDLYSGGLAYSTSNPTSRDRLRQAFIDRSYTGLQSALPVPTAQGTENGNESYQDAFLCHAQLYVFAEEKDIQKLKTLALENLHETLKHFILDEKRTGDIVSLLRYVYQNTQPPESTKTEPLRALLTDYIGFEMDTLMKDEDFNALMIEDGGPLLSDFVEMVMRRI